ncbi:MAG: hypothetical protein KDB00_07160, partial [Planctomycetales bacterium]|nr:hypothetical protein [Planctomycetales bacterium]
GEPIVAEHYLTMLMRAVAWRVSFHFQEKPVAKTPNPELARQWRDRMERFEHSGLTVAEFCKTEKYSVASFYQWRRKLANKLAGDARTAAFVPVELSPGSLSLPHGQDAIDNNSLQIELPGGALVRVGAHASDDQQRRLIKNVVEILREVAS